MRKIQIATLTAGLMLSFSLAQAATKTYQVTGPVLEVNGNNFVVDKGGEKWELTKDDATKVSGEIKVGAKVTAKYKMIATDVEVKAADAKKKGK